MSRTCSVLVLAVLALVAAPLVSGSTISGHQLGSSLPFWCDAVKHKSTYTYRQTNELSPAELAHSDCTNYLSPGRNGKAFVDLMFKVADTDNDGFIVLREASHIWNGLNAVVKRLAEAFCMNDEGMFMKCDADRDGRISKFELGFVNGCFDSCMSRAKTFKYLGSH